MTPMEVEVKDIDLDEMHYLLGPLKSWLGVVKISEKTWADFGRLKASLLSDAADQKWEKQRKRAHQTTLHNFFKK